MYLSGGGGGGRKSPKKEARVRCGRGPFSLKKDILYYIAYKISAYTAFATEAAGTVVRLVSISALCSLSVNVVPTGE